MQMVCPECGLTKSVDAVPMKLQVCPRCRAQGAGTYLEAPGMEMQVPIPSHRFVRRAVSEQRALPEQTPLHAKST